LKEEAKTALGRKDKKGALNIMRKVTRVRKEIQDKDIQYQRLLSILEQLASSKQTKEIIDVYKAGSQAFKETLERQGLTPDKVWKLSKNINL
jgi:charged multivesicular body protein 7